MSTKNLSGECQHCGGRFEFPAEAAGLTGECPHCGKQTECLLASLPDEESPAQARAIIYTAVAVVILVGGLIGAFVALRRAQRQFGRPLTVQTRHGGDNAPKPADPFAQMNFRVGAVTLEPTPGTKLVHAVGSLVNTTNRQRFGVKVELDLFDGAGQWVAKTSDYQGVIEPNAEWTFRAPVLEAKAAFAKIVSIKEAN